MNTYEFTFLVDDEAEVKNLKSVIDSYEGKIESEKNWGERELAFTIDKKNKAKYYTWRISLSPKDLFDFKKKLNFNDKLMRYLILKAEKNS